MNNYSICLSILLILSNLWGCGRPSVQIRNEEKKIKKQLNPIVKDIGDELEKVEEDISNRNLNESILTRVSNVRNWLNQIKKMGHKSKNIELFQQYCDAELGMLITLERNVQHSHWRAAEITLDKIKKLQEEIKEEFNP